MQLRGRQLICAGGHRFDIARQGYVNLTTGRGGTGTADSAAMVVARDRFLSRGHYQPVAASVRSLAAQGDHGGQLGLIGIDQRKSQRLAEAFRGYARSGVTRLRFRLALDHAALTALVTMGPSARHLTQETLAARIHALPSPATVAADLQIRAYRHRQRG